MTISRRWSLRVLTVVVPLALVATAAFKAGEYAAPQPHMNAALAALESAEKHLGEAPANKGGHRAKAMEHVKEAIAEVHAGITFADAKH